MAKGGRRCKICDLDYDVLADINDKIINDCVGARELVELYPQLGITTQNFYTHKAHADGDLSRASYAEMLKERKDQTALTKEPYPVDENNHRMGLGEMQKNLAVMGSTGDRRVDTALILDDIIACLPNVIDTVTVKDVIAAAKLKHEIFGDIGKVDNKTVEINMNVLLQQVAIEANNKGVTQEDIDLAIDMEEEQDG